MLLGDRIGYPDFRSLKKFIPDFRPDMEGRIVVVRHEDSD
ncbi:hypothetical protein BFAG_04695 [Bacteroides fragilis 3_1_12]|uniref:Uncharacterized protein n=1 Tax=Bacteroides fragilis 3_1_12 TaxID=457424 RepID=A0ABN0BSX4_BACFG|nr:hypothetical protein BFAG_04695 [Bacteroides fragilis 3_1_12]